eukprot:4547439-Heterocapsa_arctica.AAC.1
MILGNLLLITKQEVTAKKSLLQIINRRDRPEGYEEVWEAKLRGCVEWPTQKLFDYSAEFEAIGTRRNSDITQERCENWRKWSAEAMDNGAKRAY